MQQVYRFGADARSMIPAAFKYQGRFPSAALVVPSGFSLYGKASGSKQWFSTKNLSMENHMDRVSAILPRLAALT